MKSANLAGFIPILFLAACAGAPKPDVRTVEVKIPVAVACVPKKLPGPPPSLAQAWDAARAAKEPGDLLLALGAYAKLAHQRLGEVEPVIAGCR